MYLPYAQSPWNVLHVIVESDAPEARNIATLHAALRALRPDLAVEPVESLSMIVSRGVRNWRFGAWLLSVFVALAVVLAAIGLMTTMGWWVHARTLEIGVPIALGATRRQLTRLVLGQGLALGVAGIMAGCATAAGVTRYMERWFYGVPPLDPATFAACALAMLLVAGLALLLPVRQATTVDPIVALRAE